MENREGDFMIYAKIGDCFQQIGGSCPADYIQMQGERPTPKHVAKSDGTWGLPAPQQQEYEQIDPTILALAEAVAAQEERIQSLEGGAKS